MTRIEAAEESFSKANSYFIMAWVVTALVLITSFVDWRAYKREVAANDALIAFYTKLESDAASVAKELRSAVYLTPEYIDEATGIETLRRLRSEVIARVIWVEDNYSARMPNISIDDRLVIQGALNFMRRMLLLNDAVSMDYVAVEGEPALLLAEHVAGSYLTAEKIEHLRMEDATRYLWMSSLDLPYWNDVLRKHQTALSAGSSRADMIKDFHPIIHNASTLERRSDRKKASKLWVNWLGSTKETTINGAGHQSEARRRSSLTLAQSSMFLDQALTRKAELDLLADGQSSTVEIPIVTLPLQLSDAIVVAPWLVAFCSLSIMIYTRRAIRYTPDNTSKDEIVGNVPIFYFVYGIGSVAGTLTAVLLLWLPPVLMAVLLPAMQSISITSLNSTTAMFFGGVALAILLSFLAVVQVKRPVLAA